MQTDGRATYVVGDVHGHLDELLGALADAGLVDDEATWSGGDTDLWFLGDFVDRGPDGLGVIDLVMRLASEAEKVGGHVETLLGNHEILLLGMHRFGNTEVPSDFGPRSFARSWEMNGGQPTDQEGLTDRHIDWLSSRPAIALVGEHLLVHSDTVEYLVWGADIEQINAGIEQVLRSDDIVEWWEVWRRLTTRHAFRGPHGGDVAAQLLSVLGGDQVVHGHSVIADLLGVAPAQIETPYEYADGRALGVDGGVFVGGPCLVVRLPYGGKPDDDTPTDDTPADEVDAGDSEPEADPDTKPAPEAGGEPEPDIKPETAELETVEPEPDTEPEAAEPAPAGPEPARPEPTGSDTAESDTAEPDTAEPDTAGSDTAGSEPADAEATESTEVESNKPDIQREPDTKPDPNVGKE